MNRLDRLAVASLFVPVVLLAASCGSGSDSDDGNDSAGGTGAVEPKLFADDFSGVCSGATQSGAADYDPAATHKVVFFQTYEDDLLDQSSSLPTDWTVTFDENADNYAQVDLVACAVRTAEEPAKTCDGYEDDESGGTVTVNWFTATYELAVYAAKTGESLGSTVLEADDKSCPSFITFDQGDTEIDMYATPAEAEIVEFLKPIVAP